jgi:hypothetical protein
VQISEPFTENSTLLIPTLSDALARIVTSELRVTEPPSDGLVIVTVGLVVSAVAVGVAVLVGLLVAVGGSGVAEGLGVFVGTADAVGVAVLGLLVAVGGGGVVEGVGAFVGMAEAVGVGVGGGGAQVALAALTSSCQYGGSVSHGLGRLSLVM